ncbi:transcription factor of the MADS box [Rhodotorula toruloides]
MPPRASTSAPSLAFNVAPEQSQLRAQPSNPAASRGRVVAKPRFQKMSGQSKRDGSFDEDEDEGEEDVEVDAEQEEDEDDGEGEDDTLPAQGKRKGKAPAAQARKPRFPNKRNTQSVGRRKIKIDYIQDKARRHVTFTKRKSGLMKKAYELSTLTGTDCFVLVVSESGAVYTFSTTALSGITDHPRGKEVLEAVLRGELRGDAADDAPVASGSGSNVQQASYEPPSTSAAPAEQNEHPHDPLHDIMLPHFELDPALSGLDLPVPPMMGDSSSHFPSSSSALHPGLFSGFDLGGHSSSDFLHLPPTTTASTSSAPLPLPPLDFTAPLASTSSSASLFSATTATAAPPTAAASPPTSTSSSLTPYELARLSHAAAFASYQATVPFDRAPSYVLGNAGLGQSVKEALKPLEKGEEPPAAEEALRALRDEGSPHEGAEGKKGSGALKRKHGASDFGEEAWALVKKVKERASTSGGVGSLGIQSGFFAAPSPAGQAGAGSGSSPGESVSGLEAIRWAARSTTNSPAGAFGASNSPAAGGGAAGTPRVGLAEDEAAGEEVSSGEGVQERKARWKLAAAEVLQEAKRTRTVSTILRAYCYSLYATSPLPPPFDPSAPLYSLSEAIEGLHWASFARMCEKARVEDVGELALAAEEWLGRWLPREFSNRVPAAFLRSALAAARAIFLPFTDFLEAHALAPDSVCMRLVSPVPATDETGGFTEERQRELYASEGDEGGGETEEGREGAGGGAVEEAGA